MRQFAGIGLANLVFLLSQLLVLSFLAALAPIEVVGQFGLVMALIQPVFMLFTMGMRPNIATDTNHQFSYAEFSGLVVLNGMAFVAVVLGLVALIDMRLMPMALPLVLQKLSELQNLLTYGALQRAGQLQVVARSLVLRGLVGTLVFGGVLWFTGSAVWAFWAQTGVWLVALIVVDMPRLNAFEAAFKPRLKPSSLKTVFVASWALGIGMFVTAMNMSLPRFVIGGQIGLVALALFTPVSQVQRAVLGLFESVEQTFVSRLSLLWSEGTGRGFYRVLGRIFLAVLIVDALGIALAVFLGEWMLRIAFGTAYSEASTILVWAAIAIAIRLLANTMQIGLIAQRRFGDFLSIQVCVLLVTAPAVWFSISQWGLNGAGIGLVVEALARFVLVGAVFAKGIREGQGKKMAPQVCDQ